MADEASHSDSHQLDEESHNLDELFGDDSSSAEHEGSKMEVDKVARNLAGTAQGEEAEMVRTDDDDDDDEVMQQRRQLNAALFDDDESDDDLARMDDRVEERPAASRRATSKNVLGKKEISLRTTTNLEDTHFKPYLFKLPGFIAVEEEEYSRDKLESEELALLEVDAQGNYPKDGLLRLSTSVRWRLNPVTDALETNARVVRWSDGSLSLSVGMEQFEIMTQNTQKENSYLYARHAKEGCMEAVGKLSERLAVRPFVTANQSHRKFLAISTSSTQSTTHASGREAAKVKIAVTTADPEKEKQRMIKLEQEKIKSKRKVEARRRNIQSRSYERVARTGLSARFLEEDEGGEVGEDQDRYEDDFIDDANAVAAAEEEDSEEDTDYQSGQETEEGESDSGGGSEDDESTAQESEGESESEDERPKKRKLSPPKKSNPPSRKSAKIADSDGDE